MFDRVAPAQILRGAGASGDRGVPFVFGRAPTSRPAASWREPRDAEAERSPLGHLRRALRLPAAGAAAASAAAHRGARRGIELPAGSSQAAAARGGPQAASLRAVRTGRDVARRADGPRPRSRQRGLERQPPRQPPDPVPELQRDARHALAAARTGASRARASIAPPSSDHDRGVSASAPAVAASYTMRLRCAWSSVRASTRSVATSSRWGTRPPAASTAYRTTRFASGCGRMSARPRRPCAHPAGEFAGAATRRWGPRL